jgi:hypothetical protein
MKTTEQPRNSSVVREELSDLKAYLDNLPATVRNSGVFKCYELRLHALDEESSGHPKLGKSSGHPPKQ